jgi:predicted DNA-binding protein (UPF0251 family)
MKAACKEEGKKIIFIMQISKRVFKLKIRTAVKKLANVLHLSESS